MPVVTLAISPTSEGCELPPAHAHSHTLSGALQLPAKGWDGSQPDQSVAANSSCEGPIFQQET